MSAVVFKTIVPACPISSYRIHVAEKTVTLEYQGQDVSVFDEELEVDDAPTELKLLKVDALDREKALEGARFRLWNDEGTLDEELVTDEDGAIDVPYLKHGTYHLQETEAPQGYVICDVDGEGEPEVYDLTVNDQGMFELEDGSMAAVLEMEIENMPKAMHTTATDGGSGTHEGQSRGELTIVDAIEYTGTVPGNEYKVTGELMDKATGEPALDDKGNEITAEAAFTADDFAGTVEVTFAFDGVNLAGKSLVAFETMESEGAEYMVHADIDDADQTVSIVDIRTQARNPETGDQTGIADNALKLVDTVSYEGLAPGSTYLMTGHVADAETGDLLLDADGNAYVAIQELTPDEADGAVEMEFEIDATALAGKTTVFFEQLVDVEGNVVAAHEDLSDGGQSILFPSIATHAVDGADGDKNVIAGDGAKVVDTVAYENLIPGKEYVVTGILMDKATGEPMKDAQGEEVSAIAAFTPEQSDGETEVVFELDATGLEGKTAVIFESLVKDGIEVAAHADIDDEAQTVNVVPAEPEGKGYPKTGAVAAACAVGASACALSAFCLAGGGSALLRRREESEAEPSDEE